MFDNFLKLYDLFKEKNIENPLGETLKVFNILSDGRIHKIDQAFNGKDHYDLESIIAKRENGMPVEYALGLGRFFDQTFICEPGALIPREETELLVQVALDTIKKLPQNSVLNVVDMGTGCGSIAISIALNTKAAQLFASDLNKETVAVAQKNIAKFQLENRITLFQGDLFAPFDGHGLEEKIDMIVCNPPYIPSTSLKKMAAKIIDYEPVEAFNGGSFGIEFYRRLILNSLIFLKPRGFLTFEIGVGQDKLVTRLFTKNKGYKNLEYFDDGENVRVISAQKEA